MKINARGIHFRYSSSSREVLSGIDFNVEPGEKVALLGANGCGKTTLLKVLCGLLAPTQGELLIDGEPVKSTPSFGFKVGFVPENPEEMFFESTVEREISFILRRKKENGIDERITKVLNDFGISHLRHASPFELSSGEKKKTSIAAVVVGEQPVVLLDEPISGLDWNGIQSVEQWIRDSNKSVIVTSHRTDFARLFDRVVLMNSGTIVSHDLDVDRSRETLEKSGVLLLWR